MQCVKLVVPQKFYDKLKLRPNQTIKLSKLKHVCKSDMCGHNVPTVLNSEGITSEHHEPLPTESEINEDSEASESTDQNSEASVLRVAVDVGNGLQKILTYRLESVAFVANMQKKLSSEPENASNESDDVAESVKGLNSAIYEPQTQDNNESVCMNPEKTSGEPDSVLRNDIVSTMSQKTTCQPNKQSLLEPEPSEENDDHVANELSLENPDDSSLAVINAENEEHVTLTYNVKSTSRVANESEKASYNFDDIQKSARENSYETLDLSVLKVSERNKTSQMVLPSPQNSFKTERKLTYSKICATCKHQFADPRSFFKHAKRCLRSRQNNYETRRNYTYPRICGNCNRQYASQGSFLNHRKKCQKYKENMNRNVGKIMYPRVCTKCNRSYKSKTSYSGHKKMCLKRPLNPKQEYPRCCVLCNRFYKNRSSFCCHKKKCMKPRQPRQPRKRNPRKPNTLTPHPEMCPICLSSYPSRQSLNAHQLICYKRKAYNPSNLRVPSRDNVDASDVEYYDAGVNVVKKTGEWIPVEIDSKRARYFVVKKSISREENVVIGADA